LEYAPVEAIAGIAEAEAEAEARLAKPATSVEREIRLL
jgi:hypothetical protein